ncbi:MULTISPECIES: ABC transporter permease [Microbacterium]|uniref:ABC transporter permease subunit n=1 Tax=Microbacterium mcarthurae TaxID=3035918 RepID=A0ABW9GG72_9MICO|nr:ABC transporter permease subunit [Microbacterium sp. ACRRU]MCG7418522.1 ABC transporter permease subunit [Microbacterium sp. ACRRU]
MSGDTNTLTRSRGAGRVVRWTLAVALSVWFALPLLPLVLWSFAESWTFPDPFPTVFGGRSISAAVAFGAVPAFGRSLVLGLVVAVLATAIGALAARALTFGAVPGARVVSALLLAPVALPPFAAVLGVNVVLLRAHIPSVIGVALVLTVLALPYTAFVMRTAYGAYDPSYEEEARLLGAGRLQVLRRVHLPMIAPALARAAFLAFLVAWSDYIVTLIVGGGELVTLPLVVASAAAGLGNDAAVAVMSLVAVVPPIVLLTGVLAVGRGRRGHRRSRRPRRPGTPVAPHSLERAPDPVPARTEDPTKEVVV